MCREALQDKLLKDGVAGPDANIDGEVGEDEAYPPIRARIVEIRQRSRACRPVEIFPKSSRSRFRQVAQSDRLEIGIGDRIHPVIVIGFIS